MVPHSQLGRPSSCDVHAQKITLWSHVAVHFEVYFKPGGVLGLPPGLK